MENNIQKAIHQDKVQHARVTITMNNYQFANILKAIRMAEQTGDWYMEVLGKIEQSLRDQGLSLDEFHRGEEDLHNGLVQVYNGAPNVPYPEDFTVRSSVWNKEKVEYNKTKPSIK